METLIRRRVDLGLRYLPIICPTKRTLGVYELNKCLKETKSATMNIFRFFYFLFKSFLKVELSYVFTINLFTIAENCTEK